MMAAPGPTKSLLLDYLRLIRAPNVFTALADVTAGYLVIRQDIGPASQFVLLALASLGLYTAGMVLNDVFDLEVDRQERPQRPLPSGRITLPTAQRLGFGLLLVGVLCGWLAGFAVRTPNDLPWRPGLLATALAAAVLLYDGIAKKTALGPIVMGSCRLLNLLLGMSIGGVDPQGGWGGTTFPAWQWAIAGGIGIYIAGVTWFARQEARESQRIPLLFGLSVMGVGIALFAGFPHWTSAPLKLSGNGALVWMLLVLLLAMSIARRCAVAIWEPTPQRVQSAVKHSILSLIFFDAAICFGFVDWRWGIAIMCLLIPTLLLGRWVYST